MAMNKQSMNEVYDAVVITAVAVGVSMLSKKVLKEPLGTPESLKGTAKLAVAVSLGALGTKYLQEKGIIPVEPFKGK